MNKNQNRYQYIPYDEEESLAKVESSNHSPTYVQRLHEDFVQESQQKKNIQNKQAKDKGRPFYPFENPGLWRSDQCAHCNDHFQAMAAQLGVVISREKRIKKIHPLLNLSSSTIHLSYGIEYEDSRFQKFTSNVMSKWYLKQMVQFLEDQVL